ncbi:MAG: hypothetical protein JJ878_14220 [Alphaproteobacteria bacterium]|nr:hypothetical protein [Alphaproteobacteria bacterium]MBO6863791.1 hypothetical protein [Alphaproteobacteria bacterium]
MAIDPRDTAAGIGIRWRGDTIGTIRREDNLALCTDAAMVLFYDIAGDTADHDDWHSYEHLHERLSIPGFVRASRWVSRGEAPRYMAIYEVTGIDVGTSPDYLARLNAPTPWTSAMMPRFRGMVRGFCSTVASSGYGLGNAAVVLRFAPPEGGEARLTEGLAAALPGLTARKGMAGAQVMRPAPPPPMTREQAIRGADAPQSWLLIATAYDRAALTAAMAAEFGGDAPPWQGLAEPPVAAPYDLHYVASAEEVARSPAHPPIVDPAGR